MSFSRAATCADAFPDDGERVAPRQALPSFIATGP
jgi:hypothetical protein